MNKIKFKLMLPIISLIILLAIILSLNIALLCQPIYLGNYTYYGDKEKITFNFDKHTYVVVSERNEESIIEYGFYFVVPKGSKYAQYNPQDYDRLFFEKIGTKNYVSNVTSSYNPFCISFEKEDDYGHSIGIINYFCAEAIVLQTLYLILMLTFLISAYIYYQKIIKPVKT